MSKRGGTPRDNQNEKERRKKLGKQQKKMYMEYEDTQSIIQSETQK